MANENGALVQLRAYIAQGDFAPNDRLPPERKLCEDLGVGRAELRKCFAVLETEGAIWRHVGKGTFMGPSNNSVRTAPDPIDAIAKQISPGEIMHARLILEPQLAREAAIHSTATAVELLRKTADKSRTADNWRAYETYDNQLHRLIAEASRSIPLLALFDQLNALRRTVVWGRLRPKADCPPVDHHSFAEHDALIDAIEERDAEGAEIGMRQHLKTVTDVLFP